MEFEFHPLLIIILIIFIITLLFLLYNESTDHQKKIRNKNKKIKRYKLIEEITGNTFWEWDIKKNHLVFNRLLKREYGYNPKKINQNIEWWLERIHPEDSVDVSIDLYKFVAGKGEATWFYEYRFLCADGSYKHVLDRGQAILRDKNGSVLKMIGTMQDVSVIKLEEERLKQLDKAINQSREVKFVLENIDDDTLPTIIYINDSITNLLGINKKNIVDKPIDEALSDRLKEKYLPKLKLAIARKMEFSFEENVYTTDGDSIWINFTIYPIEISGEESDFWIGIIYDITNQKLRQLENESLIKELIVKNNELRHFSYITSHNLRAPIANLKGIIQLMLQYDPSKEEVIEYLNALDSSTNLLNETIEDLMKVIIIKDKLTVEKELLSIENIINQIVKQLSISISEIEPVITTKFEVKTLNLNKSYFESIMLNLISNSLKYRKLDQTLHITINTFLKENQIVLEFEDNGIGIDLERNKDKIFGLYQKFHNRSDSKGMGLYIIKNQVEAMNGTITVESKENIGTKFTLTFNP